MALPAPLPFLLVVARVAGLVASAPLFAHGVVPVRVRAGVVGILGLALAPVVPGPVAGVEPSWPALAGLVAVEAAIGVLLGLVAQLVFAGVELGGQIAGVQVGFGVASVVDPSTEAGAGLIAHWQQLVALVAFLVLDVHHVVLRALVESFRVAPIGGVVLGAEVLRGVVAQGAGLFVVGVRIAAPVLVVLLATNAALGALARTLPQLNVFAVGAPVQVGVGLVVLGTSLPFTARFLAGRFDELGGVLDALVRSLGALAHG